MNGRWRKRRYITTCQVHNRSDESYMPVTASYCQLHASYRQLLPVTCQFYYIYIPTVNGDREIDCYQQVDVHIRVVVSNLITNWLGSSLATHWVIAITLYTSWP